MTITILKTEQFQPLGKPIPRPAAPAPEPVQIKPGIMQRPDGKLYTSIPTQGPRVAPKPFFGFDLAAMPEPDRKMGEMARHAHEMLQELCGVNGAALIGFKPAAAPAAALGDGWIDCAPDMPDLKAGQYEMRNVSGGYCWASKTSSLLEMVTKTFRNPSYQYRLLPKEPA